MLGRHSHEASVCVCVGGVGNKRLTLNYTAPPKAAGIRLLSYSRLRVLQG